MDATAFTFVASAFKHGIDETTILAVIANPFFSKLDPNRPVMLQIGFDGKGDAVEVAYDIEKRVVFHAMPLRKPEKRTRA